MFVKLRDFAIGVVTGLAVAVIIKEISDRALPYKSADEILVELKQQFKKDFPEHDFDCLQYCIYSDGASPQDRRV